MLRLEDIIAQMKPGEMLIIAKDQGRGLAHVNLRSVGDAIWWFAGRWTNIEVQNNIQEIQSDIYPRRHHRYWGSDIMAHMRSNHFGVVGQDSWDDAFREEDPPAIKPPLSTLLKPGTIKEDDDA